MQANKRLLNAFLLPIFIFFIVNCVRKAEESKDQKTISRYHLRLGMLAIEAGDHLKAEEELKTSLEKDATNSRARAALASVYAGRAGVVIADLVVPLYEGSLKLDDSRVDLLKHVVGLEGESLVRKYGTDSQGIQAADKSAAFLEKMRVASLQITRAIADINAVMFLIKVMPQLPKNKALELKKAIDLLREENVEPQLRSEEVRMYLAILVSTQVIQHIRGILGEIESEKFTLLSLKGTICPLEQIDLIEKITMIQDDLKLFSEGLVAGPSDLDSKKRSSRLRLYNAVERVNNNPNWRALVNVINGNEEDSKMLVSMAKRFCSDSLTAP